MGYYFLCGGSNYVKVKNPKVYESLLDECHDAYVWLPDEEGRLRYHFGFCEHWDCGSIYYVREDEIYFHNFLDEVPDLLEEGETLVQLYSSSYKGVTESRLTLAIVHEGQPVQRIKIEPEVAFEWKKILDEYVRLNEDVIKKIDELEIPHTQQKNEEAEKKWVAQQAKMEEERRQWLFDNPEVAENNFNDEDLPF